MTPTIEYDQELDAAYLRLSTGEIAESEEVSPGIVLDFGGDGHIVGLEILYAHKRLSPELLRDAMPRHRQTQKKPRRPEPTG